MAVHICAKGQSNGANGGKYLSTVNIPVWEKANLNLEEAAAYYNIGINKLRELTNAEECEKYVLWVGNRRLIKRRLFDKYLSEAYSI